MIDYVDVAIVGAGPAGSALATRLATRGRSVVLIEAGAFTSARVGESLAPAVKPLLHDLGAWEAVERTAPIESLGTKSRWIDDGVTAHSHLFSIHGVGWHVDRRAFDECLARLAAERGAALLLNSPVRDIAYDGLWRLRAGDELGLNAVVLVDATGRRGRIARMLGAARSMLDHLVGVGRVWEGVDDEQPFVGVEAAADGWWYSAPLPGGALITLLMTDADVCRTRRLTDDDTWRTALEDTTLTVARLGPSRPATTVRSHAAYTARLLRSDRRPWLAVGDAALAVDPLSGSGVVRAVRMAAQADPIVDEMVEGRFDGVERYERARHVECHEHIHERLAYYAACQLYDTPFWARRHSVAEQTRAGTAAQGV